MTAVNWEAPEPADTEVDPDDLTDEDFFDEDAWDDIAREEW